MSSIIELMKANPNKRTYAPATEAMLQEFEGRQGFTLPPELREFLLWTNGAEFGHGQHRIFGIPPTDAIDSVWWNDEDTWKFSWRGIASPYWAFAENAWGIQSAYRIDELQSQGVATIYTLITCGVDVLSPAFHEFAYQAFGLDAYDGLDGAARARFGWLPKDQHLCHVPPSYFLQTWEMFDINYVSVMDARAQMIADADLWFELESVGEREWRGIEAYQDERGRPRVRILWK